MTTTRLLLIALVCVSATHAVPAQDVQQGLASPPAPTLKARPENCDPAAHVPPARCARLLYAQTTLEFAGTRNPAQADAGFARVLELDPTYAPAWFNRGVLAEARHNWADAKTGFTRYLQLAPHGPDAARAAAELQVLEPYLAGAVSTADRTRIAYTNHIQRARVLLDAALYRQAVDLAGQAQALDPTRWEAYAVLALAMARQGHDADAKHFAELCLQRTPAEQQATVRQALGTATP